jgi:hypothetical protein
MASFPDRAMERQSNNIDVRTAIDHNGKNAPAPAVHGLEARQNLLKRTDSPPKACRYRAATAALSSRFGGHRGDAVLGVARFVPDQDAQGLGRQKWAMVLSRKMRLSRRRPSSRGDDHTGERQARWPHAEETFLSIMRCTQKAFPCGSR